MLDLKDFLELHQDFHAEENQLPLFPNQGLLLKNLTFTQERNNPVIKLLTKHFLDFKNDLSRFNLLTNSNVNVEDIDFTQVYKLINTNALQDEASAIEVPEVQKDAQSPNCDEITASDLFVDEFKHFLPDTEDLECDMHLPFNLDDNQPFDLKSNSSEEASESQILNLDEIEPLEPQPELDPNHQPRKRGTRGQGRRINYQKVVYPTIA